MVTMFALPDAPGAPLTREQVLFSWALGEAFSLRWQNAVLEPLDGGLRQKIGRHETHDYSPQEQNKMVEELRKRRPFLAVDYIDKAASYKLLPLPADQLGRIAVLPTFSWKEYPVPLSEYMTWPCRKELKDDARLMAKEFLKSPPPVIFTGYPIVAYNPELKSMVLIDGYARCITTLLRLGAGENLLPMLVIYCAPKK